jgi:DNA-binding XRE family transcriptional regulator
MIGEEYELDFNPADVGEAVQMIRIRHLKMSDEAFAKEIGVSPKTLYSVENGSGPHGLTTLKKINEKFDNVEVGILLKFK